MSAKLDIKKTLSALDKRDHDYYNNLTSEEKKLFSPFILMRFSSNVNSNQDIQEWFVETTNEYVNKNYFLLARNHKGLLWKLYASTGIGNIYFHPYIGLNRAENNKENFTKIETLIANMNPGMKMSDVRLLIKLMTKEDIKELLDGYGFDNKERREYE